MAIWFIDGGGAWRYCLPHIKKDDTIVGSGPAINQYFKEFHNCKVIELKHNPTLVTDRKLSSVYRNMVDAEKDYNKYFKNIKNEDIYLFGRVAVFTFFSFIRKLSKNNNIHLVCIGGKISDKDFFIHTDMEHSHRSFFMKLFAWYFYDLKINIKTVRGNPQWVLHEESIPLYDFFYIEPDEPRLENKKIDQLLDGKDTLLLMTDLKNITQNYMMASDQIARWVGGKNTVAKSHTQDFKLYGRMNDLQLLPYYIPAELLMNHKWKNIIGAYSSKALLSAKKLTDAKIITCIDLYEWKYPIDKLSWMLRMRSAGILIPETFEELKEMIK